MFAGCVIPPPLTVDNDGGVNSPPNIINVTDPSFNSHRPPDTLTVNNSGLPQEITVTIVENDLADDLVLQLFVDYDPLKPVDADVNCSAPAPPEDSRIRTANCTTQGLCADAMDVGLHRLEIEVYDRPPLLNEPYRDLDPASSGFFATWTFQLQCQNPT